MPLLPVLLLGVPLLVALVVLALRPWRSQTMTLLGPVPMLLVCGWWTLRFDDVGTWLLMAGPFTAVALVGAWMGADRFLRRRRRGGS